MSLLLSLVRAMFLLQQLPPVGVQLVQLRIAAATEIVCAHPNTRAAPGMCHRVCLHCCLLTFRALGLTKMAFFEGREGQGRFPSPLVESGMVWTQQHWCLTCLCSPQAGTLLLKKMANAEDCCTPGPMSTKQALCFPTDSSYECPYNSCTEDFSY